MKKALTLCYRFFNMIDARLFDNIDGSNSKYEDRTILTEAHVYRSGFKTF